jgi:hypothetical protein
VTHFYDNTYTGVLTQPTTYATTLAQWRTALGGCAGSGNECASMSSDPLLSVAFVPISISSPGVDTGANMSLYFTTDYANTSRPQGTAWDIGAYEFIPAHIQGISASGVKFQ